MTFRYGVFLYVDPSGHVMSSHELLLLTHQAVAFFPLPLVSHSVVLVAGQLEGQFDGRTHRA